MHDAEKPEKAGSFSSPLLLRRIAGKRALARCILVLEAALPRLTILLSVLALYIALSWFGVFRLVPEWGRILLLALFMVGVCASLLAFRGWRWPSRAQAEQMLESRNGLAHQPIGAQEELMAFDTPFARALWREHQARMAARIAALDVGMPRPDVSGFDRWALRTVPVLLAATGFAYSFSPHSGALGDAWQAQPAAQNSVAAIRIDAWVVPPSYTGQAPIYLPGLDAEGARHFTVPQSSELTIRISGEKTDRETVQFRSEASGQQSDIPLQTSAKTEALKPSQAPSTASQSQQTETSAQTHVMKLQTSGTLLAGGQSWAFSVTPDKVPVIAFNGTPKATVNGALEIGFNVQDDYGIKNAYAEITPLETDPGAKPLYPLPEYRLDVPGRSSKDGKGLTSRNLTKDPLAGQPVRITLVATDASGQTGRSEPREIILPQRPFHEPLAAAVAEQRQTFALDTTHMPRAIELNEAITLRPEETISNLTHYLLLESALGRMKLAKAEAAFKDTADYLWDIALGIDDGDLSLAESRMREAQKNLADALQRNASDEEIAKLTEELRKAMQAYMQELAKRLQDSPVQQNLDARNILRQQDLERMMDQIEKLARSGNREAAQQMLSEMQRMMNNLQAGRPQQGQNQANREMNQQIDKLGEIMRDQQKLMDETYRLDQALKDRLMRDQSGMEDMPQQPDSSPQEKKPENQMSGEELRQALKQLRQQQDALEKKLGQIQKDLGKMGLKPGPGFGQAQKEMKGAVGQLGQGEGEQALQGQGRALEALRQGARDMMNQMAGQGGQGGTIGRARQTGQGRDPLGREQGSNQGSWGSNVKIPDEIDTQRAREILDAIRKKLGTNPAGDIERRYLERLLDLQ